MTVTVGTLDARFAAVRDQFANNLDSGLDTGASVAVTLDGEFVVDLWGGWADEAKTQPWQRDTIVNVWSSTKTMTSLAALALVARGELDVDAPVAKYWPDFAANGKGGVLVRHLMSHTSGVPAWAPPVTVEDIYDWEKSTAMLAAQSAWWEPGTASGYHALNQGHLVGEVIRRVTGLRLGQFFAKEVAGPLGADFHIGLSPMDFGRVSNVIPPPPEEAGVPLPGSLAATHEMGPAPDATMAHSPAWRRADIGAANGHGNARSVARCQSIVSCGGTVEGVTLLNPATCDLIFREQSNGVDLMMGQPTRFGIGYGLRSAGAPFLPEGRKACFWGGWGGSLVVNDLDARMTFAFMMNRMAGGTVGDLRAYHLLAATYAALGVTI